MAAKNDKTNNCCESGSDDGHNKAEYLELDESAAEYGVEETNKKETSA